MRNATLSLLLLTALSGCATVRSSGPACPSLPAYSAEQMKEAADELDAMPDGSIIATVYMPNYGTMRDGVRACLKARDSK